MKRMNLIMSLTTLLLAAATLPAPAQIMKCVGKDGKIEFASSCPSGTKQQDTGVTSKPAPAAKSDAKSDGKSDAKADAKDAKAADKGAPKSLADRDAEFRKRQVDQKAADEKSAKAANESADRQRACQGAQANLLNYKNRVRMFGTDPKTGERIAYEEADFQRETAIAERQVAENCK